MSWISFGVHPISIDQLSTYLPKNDFERSTLQFINDWSNGGNSFSIQTSGSTGKPKIIIVSRQQMVESAKATIKALKLMPGQTSLLCMAPKFIGGKMMIVRSLLRDMNIVAVAPSSDPLKVLTESIDFTAMVPLQVKTILEDSESTKKLSQINNVLIGGGSVDSTLQKQLKALNIQAYSTYGMTETVSHIALKKLDYSGSENYFTALDGVSISIDNRNCLVVNAPMTNNIDIVTNDVVEIIDFKKFKWLGRYDNVINSGGIKIHPEKLEGKISGLLAKHGFNKRLFVFGKDDNLLGQKLVLVLEGSQITESLAQELLKASLDKYEVPKEILFSEKFIETQNGKIQRSKTVQNLI